MTPNTEKCCEDCSTHWSDKDAFQCTNKSCECHKQDTVSDWEETVDELATSLINSYGYRDAMWKNMPPNNHGRIDAHELKAFLRETVEKARKEGANAAVDYIEANTEELEKITPKKPEDAMVAEMATMLFKGTRMVRPSDLKAARDSK